MPRPLGVPQETHGKDWVALILAIGFSTSINLLVAAVLYDAIFSEASGLSENATQILTGWGGGVVGVLGGYIGYRSGERSARQEQDEADAAKTE